MNEGKFWLSLLLGLAGIFWAGIVGTCLVCKSWDQQYIEAGYYRATLPGYGTPQWVKADPSKP